MKAVVAVLLSFLCISVHGSDVLDAVSKSMDDTTFLNLLSASPDPCPAEMTSELLTTLVRNGLVKSARTVAQACVDKDIKLDEQAIQKVVNGFRKDLSDFTSYMQSANRELAHVFPAFEWAQSKDSLFVSVKFAHKLDTPACIDVVDDEAEMTNVSVVVSAICKGKKKQFTLQLDLLKEIVPENSTWSMASVGRGLLTLRKSEEKEWARLLKTRDRVKNMHKWFTLQEKYDKELKELREPHEREVSEEEQEESSVKESSSQTPLEIEQQRQVKVAQKKAKSAKKKLKKQMNKEVKQVDTKTNSAKSDLDKQATADKKSIKDKYDAAVAEIDTNLASAIESINSATSEEESSSLFDKIASMFTTSSSSNEQDEL